MHITILITCLLTLDTNDKNNKKKRGGNIYIYTYILYHISYNQFLFLLQVYI